MFVTQLPSNAGNSVWQTVWVATYCHLTSNVLTPLRHIASVLTAHRRQVVQSVHIFTKAWAMDWKTVFQVYTCQDSFQLPWPEWKNSMGKIRATHPFTWLTSLVRPMSFTSDKKTKLMSTARVQQKMQENTCTQCLTLMQLQGYPQLCGW